MRRIVVAVVAALAGAVLAAVPGEVTAQDKDLDAQAVRDAMPRMKELSDQGVAHAVKLHKLLEQLEASQDGVEQKALREEIRTTLAAYREVKAAMITVTRPLVGLETTNLSDREVLDKLKDTELHGVAWSDANFDKCVRDLSKAVGIPIRLQFRVVQKNKVTMRFQKTPAETILAALCNGFDLRYVIHGGEIVVYKQITPTEERFLEYQKRHPEVKLRYWEQEDASGAYSGKKGGGK
jgi:hypothetical protein